MAHCCTGFGACWPVSCPYRGGLVRNDVILVRNYNIKLDVVCRNQRFRPQEVVSSELVFPKGAVPNSQLLWIKVELISGERKFVTLPLRDFYDYIELPESSIGGWTDGELGTDEAGMRAHLEKYKQDGSNRPDSSGHDSRNEADDHRGSKQIPDDLLDGTEVASDSVEAGLPESE